MRPITGPGATAVEYALIVARVTIALVVGARSLRPQIGATFNTSMSTMTDRLIAQRREARPVRHSTLSCRASGAAQRRVSTTPRCASPATTLSSFSWSGTNLVQPGTEAARFTSFHLS
jgi:Flp pilus assembly pilin Flp